MILLGAFKTQESFTTGQDITGPNYKVYYTQFVKMLDWNDYKNQCLNFVFMELDNA